LNAHESANQENRYRRGSSVARFVDRKPILPRATTQASTAKHRAPFQSVRTECGAPARIQSCIPHGDGHEPDRDDEVGRPGIPIGIANYLTQAKAQVLGQTNTSAHFILTFGNDLTSDETITLTPNQPYTPTPVEMAESGQRPVYQGKFSVEYESETKARVHLQYFVPNTAVPADLQRRMQSSTAQWFQLVPSASAQEGGGSSMGMNVASDTAVEVTKEVLKQTAEHGKLSKEFPTPLSRLVDILNAFKKEQEHVAWLDELAELQDCAANPTNPLTPESLQPGSGVSRSGRARSHASARRCDRDDGDAISESRYLGSNRSRGRSHSAQSQPRFHPTTTRL
jgi:hypothetical protein